LNEITPATPRNRIAQQRCGALETLRPKISRAYTGRPVSSSLKVLIMDAPTSPIMTSKYGLFKKGFGPLRRRFIACHSQCLTVVGKHDWKNNILTIASPFGKCLHCPN